MERPDEPDIKRYLSLIVRRRYLFAATAAALITAVFAGVYVLPPVYEAKTIVSVERSFLNDLMKGIAVTASLDDKVNALATIMRSRTLVYKVISDLDLELNRKSELAVERLIKDFQDKTDIRIEFNKSSRKDIDFFTVSFRHENPKTARDYVNTLVGRYIEENIGAKRELSAGASRFLLDQIGLFKDKVSALDEEIAALRKDGAVAGYERLVELQQRRDALLVQYTEDHPEVMRVRAEIDVLRQQGGVRRTGASGAARPAGGASAKSRLAAFERERDIYKKIYEELAAAYGKSEVSTQAELQDKAGTFRIVDPAVLPLKPASPDRIRIMLLGIAAGLGSAMGLLVLLDMTDRSVKSMDPLRGLGVPVLAVITHIEDADETARVRRRDALLYGCSGIFLMLIAAAIAREALG